ncbi:bifunctional biotin--[acetyl-CoA-carboxylase] ligase/biotin operon repressor BirA [Alishewanella sp. SMS8]|uniref:bifunctional biotin--[acetyl-CoA-carboxylase] ligase/biotin operon repressor BirA n=1 Tax=Alishewanella sp. SMS8 TaxID=2994676 RepID=UPI0027404C63|nr:bifunctional biotin--[acetyl-CoA-carboxylase] ligase/biotin operon repressor BirA [Alishewanella sp. SMS8]MDP4946106.1 bifunctional biotin--[acetyl-CoA-carboxylase] ligase/biotin operon repressor BirA [Alishewanella sp.]MDP5035695.1 bifunctional biotin--[acetyl-CoA-carboxylase] ligase/biotin operon repressor BirA [Alishewanella sp.]MDP5187281.1 bifunctional biotin--[acetyl-CoA-carboxylase] ligase/biotin operon repressor BirA [Alishewanella sp.]MDP5460941.1 bifunctional biotin--[acetyl-CoA-ca
MSKANLQVQRQLLSVLADGKFHSGQILANHFGISRTAIANYIAELELVGLDIYKVKGKGYALTKPIVLLDAAIIRQLQPAQSAPVLVQHITDSTNLQLMQALQSNKDLASASVIVAEAQTAGRGRRGRSWYSPFGSNLYFSYYWKLEQGIQAAMGLSIVAGCALCQVLQRHYQISTKMKWPNDIYIDNRKVAGILVELVGQADGACHVVIGIGINVQLPLQALQHIDQPYADLATATDHAINRNELVVHLQSALTYALKQFQQTGFAPFQESFNQLNLYAQQTVTLSGSASATGVCKGVDNQGAILLEHAGQIVAYFGGEVSLRAAT